MTKRVVLFLFLFQGIVCGSVIDSVHFDQSRQFRDVTPPVFYGMPSLDTDFPVLMSAPVTDRLIWGYLPYWNNSTTHLRWGLLTDLLYFSCEMEAGGTLGNCNGWPQNAPIDEARKYGVRIHLVITSFSETDIKNLLGSTDQKNTFFAAVWEKVKDNKADGVNIDFEAFGKVEPRSLLTNFFNELASYMKSRKSDMLISIATPAVDWSDNWDFAGMTGVDYFFMMLYDYHWRGGEPGPVAPLVRETPWPSWARSVTRSIDDFVDANGVEIKKKLIAGYPYYGLKWKTTDSSIPGTKTENAVSVIYDKVYSDHSHIATQIDNGSKTPYKIWQEGSIWYQLWFDDAESLGLKFALANTKDLAGSGMWALNYDISGDDLWKEIAYHFVNDKSGSFLNPVKVDNFPFSYTGDTYRYVSFGTDSYDCGPDGDHFGPEIIFEIDLHNSGTINVELTEGYGKDNEREHHDIFLLRSDGFCIEGNNKELAIHLEKGKYYISVDSTVSENVAKGGPFKMAITFDPDETDDEWADDNEESDVDEEDFEDSEDFFDDDKEITDDDDTKVDDDGVFAPCVFEERSYEHDEVFDKGDDCNVCHCFNGNVSCSQKECLPEKENKSKGCSVTVI